MYYRSLQQRIKIYKQAGYTAIPLNIKKIALQDEYDRLLQLELSQEQLEHSITNREANYVDAIEPIAVYTSPNLFKIKHIKAKVFKLAEVSTADELREKYPVIKEKRLNFRYKAAWVECLLIIAEVTKQSHITKRFYKAVDRAIEIELKSIEDDIYRHETPDPDLYTLLSDNELVGPGWQKNQSTVSSLMRAYVISKCQDAGLDPSEYFLN